MGGLCAASAPANDGQFVRPGSEQNSTTSERGGKTTPACRARQTIRRRIWPDGPPRRLQQQQRQRQQWPPLIAVVRRAARAKMGRHARPSCLAPCEIPPAQFGATQRTRVGEVELANNDGVSGQRGHHGDHHHPTGGCSQPTHARRNSLRWVRPNSATQVMRKDGVYKALYIRLKLSKVSEIVDIVVIH